MAKRSELAPLDAVRLLLNSCTVKLEPVTHQVSALPVDAELEYWFVPAQHMALFAPYHNPGQPYKNLKLINYERPAISLAFFPKHKYTIDRQVGPQQAQEVLLERREQLYKRAYRGELLPVQEKELQRIDTLLRTIRQLPDQFQFCLSNYHHFYRYWYCSFRYFEDPEHTKTGTSNEHMLKYTESTHRTTGEPVINERLNIIFVDTRYITRPVAYDNKRIDQELDTYSDRISFGRETLYEGPVGVGGTLLARPQVLPGFGMDGLINPQRKRSLRIEGRRQVPLIGFGLAHRWD